MNGLIVDLFAGGGGASTGLEAALGRPVDVAINHDPIALAVHKANHPHTKHLDADIWEVQPEEAVQGRRVAILWASPDCKDFSLAKGGKPRRQNIRSLAWVVTRWAKAVRPAVIFLENVAEFKGWGPLGDDGKRIKAKLGQTFHAWRRRLVRLGYVVDYRVLDASQYGAPTRRRRLFLVARCDGLPIRWPAITHADPRKVDLFSDGMRPWRTAAECIDWSIPCPSIFERKKPLADKTLWRIAQGIKRFVLDNPTPFIVKVNHGDDARTGNRTYGIDQPLTTVTAGQRGHAIVTPSLVHLSHGGNVDSLEKPFRTITAGPKGGDLMLAMPTLVQSGYGEREGQAARALDIEQPLGTVVAGGTKHALVAAFIAKHFGERPGGFVGGQPINRPLGTVTTQDHNSLAAATLVKFRGQNHGANPDAPMPALTAGGLHVAEVRAFLTAYHASDYAGGYGQALNTPTRALTTKDRLGLVTVSGVDYQIVDIGMRMLEPHELLAAQFGRFAPTYDLSAAKTKKDKVRLIGNSVCPEAAEALVLAQPPASLEVAAA